MIVQYYLSLLLLPGLALKYNVRLSQWFLPYPQNLIIVDIIGVNISNLQMCLCFTHPFGSEL